MLAAGKRVRQQPDIWVPPDARPRTSPQDAPAASVITSTETDDIIFQRLTTLMVLRRRVANPGTFEVGANWRASPLFQSRVSTFYIASIPII